MNTYGPAYFPCPGKILFTTVLLCCVVLTGYAQSDDPVHVTPRVVGNTPASSGIDETLNTHTRPLRSNVDMVLVPVTVTDPMDRLVTGLDKDNFAIFEGKEQQQIHTVSSEDAPISLGIIFDMSGSMKDKMEKAKEAAVEFLQTGNPEDEFFMVGFSDKPELLSDFTQSIGDIQSRLVLPVGKGMTALLDGIYLGINEMKHAKHRRKALLIISDGGDNHSRYTEGEVKNLVKEADVQIYAIGIFDAFPRTSEERFGPTLLNDISEITGGRAFTVNNPNELPDIAAKIGAALRNEYVLAYLPASKPRDGKWHKIKVKLLPPKGLPPLRVYSKQGYYAPGK